MRESRSSQGTRVKTADREGERERAGSQAGCPGKRLPGNTVQSSRHRDIPEAQPRSQTSCQPLGAVWADTSRQWAGVEKFPHTSKTSPVHLKRQDSAFNLGLWFLGLCARQRGTSLSPEHSLGKLGTFPEKQRHTPHTQHPCSPAPTPSTLPHSPSPPPPTACAVACPCL